MNQTGQPDLRPFFDVTMAKQFIDVVSKTASANPLDASDWLAN